MTYSMRAKFGLSLSNRAVVFGWATMDDLVRVAQRAEASGMFHSVWVGDNLLSKPRIDAIVALSAIAARTQQVKLGTICLASFPFRHPIVLAIQWASLDILSRGRTILAVCNGGSAQDGPQFAHELEVMGVKSEERVGRLIEGVTILRRLWSEARVTHQGRYFQFRDVELLPKPVQNPVPILIAVNPKGERVPPAVEERVMRRVAAYGDGWQTDATTPETFRRRWDMAREHAERLGRDPSKLESCIHLMVNINEKKETAFREAEEFLSLYYGTGRITHEQMETWLAYGSPQAVIEKIQPYLEAGCTMPVLRFVSRNFPAQVERAIREVLPALHAP
ncbi:MAG: LLM class flavin-dependent oxidoreductase [Chloroflexi bacterium]|nr:LLM class flavin-dependent oxidoreductase [Chloroflexota bacterium]